MSDMSNLRTPLVLIPQYFGSIVFDRRTSRYLPFDIASTQILKRLQSETLNAVFEDIEDIDSQNQLARFFDHFYELGFFTIDQKFAGTVLDIEPAANHLTGPLAVHLEVIAACNLTCKHCFAGILPRKESPRLTFSELDRLFAELARMGSFRLGLTGGEPLLRRDIFDIIDLATGHGLHPCITTNGFLITEDIAREFGKRELVWLNVSLDGATPKTNDYIRGSGTFEKVVENLQLLSKHARFTLAFTIMKNNLKEIEACAELAKKLGANAAVFRPLYPVGIAQQNSDLMPTFTEYNDALNTLASIETEQDFELRSIDPFNPQTREESQSAIYQNFGCGAGNLVCSISVSGDMNPCSFLGSKFVANNIRKRSIAEIWHDSQVFRDIRALPGGTNDTFNGGCRVRSLAFNGSINAPDPWVIEKELKTMIPLDFVPVHHPMTILELTGNYDGV